MLYGMDCRRALMAGIKTLADVGQKTLGPGGRNIAIEYDGGEPKITKDGVTVLKSLHLGEREKEMGAKLLKKSTGATNIFAGDGTTTSSILAREILTRGINAIEFEGAHPVAIKRGLDKALQVVSGFLKEIALPVTTKKEVLHVCRVASNYNKNVAEIVAMTLNTVGLDGVVNITESPTGFSRFAMVNGLVYERGFVSPLFVETMH
jgi:chaperonin GroEL